jgi:hypothetical protein
MAELVFNVEGTEYAAEWLKSAAPESVEAVRDVLPLETTLRHVIWSGHAVFAHEFGANPPDFSKLPRENTAVYPSRGDVLLYPGYDAPAEILIACGETCLNDPYGGEMAGNTVATMQADDATLADLDERTAESGAKDVVLREQ